MSQDGLARRPLTCPSCSRSIGFLDLRQGRCRWCDTKICIPKAYYRPIQLSAVIITLIFVVGTFSTFFTSPASFSLVMLWFVLIFVVHICAMWLLAFVYFRISPPVVERVYAYDNITRLRLDDQVLRPLG